MKVKFTGVPGEKHESIHMYGQNFPLGEAVEVTDPQAQRKLANHPHFEADGAPDMPDDKAVRAYVNTVMDAGLTSIQRSAEQTQQQAPREPAPTPAEAPTPRALRSAQEYQAMEMSGAAPVVPKTAEQLRAELQQAEQAEQEATDGDAKRAGNADSAKAQGGRASADTQRGRSGKGS